MKGVFFQAKEERHKGGEWEILLEQLKKGKGKGIRKKKE